MPGDIIIYNGCCGGASTGTADCGCGSGGGTGGTGGSGGSGDDIGSGGGDFGGGVGGAVGVTKCDVVSYIIPYALDQAREWFDGLADFLTAGGSLVDFIEEPTDTIDPTDISPTLFSSLELLIDSLGAGVDQIGDMLADTDFLLTFQESWWRATSEDNALTGRVESLTRADLRRGNRYIPYTWGNAVNGVIILPRVVLDIFWSIINMSKVNRRLALASGQADTALCTYVAGQIGEEYVPPIDPEDVPPPSQVFTPSYIFTEYVVGSTTPTGVTQDELVIDSLENAVGWFVLVQLPSAGQQQARLRVNGLAPGETTRFFYDYVLQGMTANVPSNFQMPSNFVSNAEVIGATHVANSIGVADRDVNITASSGAGYALGETITDLRFTIDASSDPVELLTVWTIQQNLS